MAQRSAIEWTESTWNPVTGCTKVSPGCKNCYAERMARERLRSHPATAHARAAARLEEAADRVRELDERPVPQGRAARLHPARLRRDEAGPLAPLPGADEAGGASGRAQPQARVDAQHLDGSERRDRQVPRADRRAAVDRGADQVPLDRAAARTAARPRPPRHGLGDRGRRVRAALPTSTKFANSLLANCPGARTSCS